MMRTAATIAAFVIAGAAIPFQATAQNDSILIEESLSEVTVNAPSGRQRLRGGVTNAELITAQELTRAACCNLGESFTTNPSVDVSYTDAATGARQIKLLGLSGTYVQMITENIPNFRGAASPFGLGYIPGPWMQSIQVSKGASSVKNGYESITGQINVEMRKPQADPTLAINGYADHRGKAELNATGSLHMGPRWSGALLLHGENAFKAHDENGDGFIDMPRVRQIAVMNRWAYLSTNYVFQIAGKYLGERRTSGQDTHHATHSIKPLYRIGIDTHRGELFTKNAYIFDRDNDGNIALILSGSLHSQNSDYGLKLYDVRQQEAYASLMFERKYADGLHAMSAGVSYNYDHLAQQFRLIADAPLTRANIHESVAGVYGQYTLNVDDRLIAMGGLRYDHNSLYGSIVTPRIHVRYNPHEQWSVNASAGSGHRSPHPLAEYNYLLASSRALEIDGDLKMESAWNMGGSVAWHTPDERLTLSAEYYYTTFRHQLCVNFDRDPHAVWIYDLVGHSRSHAFQAEATWAVTSDLTISGAYRLTDVKADYGRGMEQKPLTSRQKGLITIGYNPMMGLWQFDASLAINGAGRMPTPALNPDGVALWNPTYGTWLSLNAQATRNWRQWSVYVGGENLTGFRQKNPIIGASDPWGPDFDSTMVYGPLHGAVVYIGFRYHITRYL